MGAEKQKCVVIRCDNGCGELMKGFEDEYIVHWDNEATALAEVGGPDEYYLWRKIGDQWCCPVCPISAEAADILEAAGIEP